MTNGQEVRLRLQVAPFGLQYKKKILSLLVTIKLGANENLKNTASDG